MMNNNIKKLLFESFEFRSEMTQDSKQIVRVCAGAGDSLPGIIIDKFGELIVVTIYNSEFNQYAQTILDTCQSFFKDTYTIVRNRDTTADNTFVYLYSHKEIPASIIAQENQIKFEIRFDIKHDYGIFRDAVAARQLFANICRDKKALNLFAYTCAFGVTGKVNGALDVVNVDPNRDYLAWARINGELNHVDFSVIPDTAQKYMARLVKRKNASGVTPFDIIISDPPAFGVGRGLARTLRTYWPEMLQQMAELEPKEIILLCNDKSVKSSPKLTKMLADYLPMYKMKHIAHTKDILGSNPKLKDNWFQPPDVMYFTKN